MFDACLHEGLKMYANMYIISDKRKKMKIFINCPRLTFKWITRTNTRENFFWNISNLVPHLVPHLRHLRHLCQKCLTLRHWGKCVPHLYHICGTCGTNINVPHFVVQWGLRTEDWGLRFVRDGNWGAPQVYIIPKSSKEHVRPPFWCHTSATFVALVALT